MQYIKSIRVRYYRSIYESEIKSFSDVNVLSGKNDSGKTNYLKALNLFFEPEKINWERDFNKDRQKKHVETLGGKRFLDISVTFNNIPGYKHLGESFTITRAWGIDGALDRRSPFEGDDKAQTQLKKFLNNFKYIYIPAVRDERFFVDLLLRLQKELFAKEDRKRTTENKIQLAAQDLNTELGKVAGELTQEILENTKISSNLNLPTSLQELFGSVHITTKFNDHNIFLDDRGHGVRMNLIPTILAYISKISKRYFILGFDEPENSCEYSLCQSMAQFIVDKCSLKTQIFLTSHSFSYTNLNSQRVSTYRVQRNPSGETVANSIQESKSHLDDLNEELGLFEISKELNVVYLRLCAEREQIDRLKKKSEQENKPLLLFEGVTDLKHFEMAHKILRGKELCDVFVVPKFGDNGTQETGGGAKYLNQLVKKLEMVPVGKTKVAIFDFDTEGVNQIMGLDFQRVETYPHSHVYQSKVDPKLFAITLCPPTFRKDFIFLDRPDWCNLSVELLYQDDLIDPKRRTPVFPGRKTPFKFGGTSKQKKEFLSLVGKNTQPAEFIGFNQTLKIIYELSEIKDKKIKGKT